jgi:hypothetical protein
MVQTAATTAIVGELIETKIIDCNMLMLATESPRALFQEKIIADIGHRHRRLLRRRCPI